VPIGNSLVEAWPELRDRFDLSTDEYGGLDPELVHRIQAFDDVLRGIIDGMGNYGACIVQVARLLQVADPGGAGGLQQVARLQSQPIEGIAAEHSDWNWKGVERRNIVPGQMTAP